MNFLKESTTWRSKENDLPLTYDAEKNLKFSKDIFNEVGYNNCEITLIPENEQQPELNKQPECVELKTLVTDIKPIENSTTTLPPTVENVIEQPINPPERCSVHLKAKPFNFTALKLPPDTAYIPFDSENNILTQLNTNKPLMEKLSHKIEEFLATNQNDIPVQPPQPTPLQLGGNQQVVEENQQLIEELELPPKVDQHISPLPQAPSQNQDFSNFFDSLKKSPNTSQPKENLPSQQIESTKQTEKLNSFFKIDHKDLISSSIDKFIDVVVGTPDLSPRQTKILELVSSIVKILIQNCDAIMNLNLDQSDSFLLTKNISLSIFILHGEKIASYLYPPAGSAFSGTGETKVKIIMLLTTPVFFRIFLKKIRSKINTPTITSTTSHNYNTPTVSKRKSATPYQDEFVEEEISIPPQPAQPIFKLPRFNTKFIRLESRPDRI